MDLSELKEGYAVIVTPCYGRCNGQPIKVGLMVVNVLNIIDELVQIEDQSAPPIFAFVDPKQICGIKLNDWIIEAIGFICIGTQCPIRHESFKNVYEQNIGGKMRYVVFDGDRYSYVRSSSGPLEDVEFVHDLQRLITGFDVSKNQFV